MGRAWLMMVAMVRIALVVSEPAKVRKGAVVGFRSLSKARISETD